MSTLVLLPDPVTTLVRVAHVEDVPACKALADGQRDALGFLIRAAFVDSVGRGQLLVAERAAQVVGFVRFNHRVRGTETALYDICVAPHMQRQGIGRQLVQALVGACHHHGRNAIVLRCPEGSPANAFYARLGFAQVTIEPGRRRRLILWRLALVEAACAS